jgi:hypothetical protein
MKRYTFILEEWDTTGGLGLRPEWFPGADPLGGVAVAHDILEHDNMTVGDVNEEIQALGRMHWIRGEGGYFHDARYYQPPSIHFATDLTYILEKHLNHDPSEGENPGWVVITDEEVPVDPDMSGYEDLFTDALVALRKDAAQRVDEYNNSSTYKQ